MRELGRALHPEYVSRRFRELAKTAGLPVIKFHAVRHTAATLALESKGLSAGSVPGRQGLRNCIMPGQCGGRGIRTHGDVAATMVFKTIAIGH